MPTASRSGRRCYGLDPVGLIQTLPDATFAVRGLEPGYPRQVIFAHKERWLVGAVTLKDEDLKSEATSEVRLGPPCSVKGRLVDEDGLPLAGPPSRSCRITGLATTTAY